MEPPRELLATLHRFPSHKLTEQEIALLWKFVLPHLRSPGRWTTADDEAVTIREPGTIGHREGPDVRGATVTIGDRTVTGAVEIHATPADWYHHGHHRDPAFNTVVLQVCLRGDPGTPARLEKGSFVPTVFVDPLYEECLRNIDERLDTEEHGRLRAVKRPCFVDDRSPPENLPEQLDRAGRAWLFHRVARLRKMKSEARLFRATVGALGYSRNHEPFLTLARALSRRQFYEVTGTASPCSMEAWLLGKAGSLPRPFSDGVNRTLYRRRETWETEWSAETPVLKKHEWNHSGVRPQCFPMRRWIWFGYCSRRIRGSWRTWIRSNVVPRLGESTFRSTVTSAFQSFVSMSDHRYWSRHYTGSDEPHDSTPAPLGHRWVDQWLINVILPWLYGRALEAGDRERMDRVINQLRGYPPVMSNRRTRRVKQQWGLENAMEWSSALEQQAAVFVYKNGCVDNNCQSCSFNRRDDSGQPPLFDHRR